MIITNNLNTYAGLPSHMMAPDTDHDPRYKEMHKYCRDNKVSCEVRDVDFADEEAFFSPTHDINNMLQPRVDHLNGRTEQINMLLKDLNGGKGLIRPLWLYESPDGLFATIAGRGRQAAIQSPLNTNKDKKHPCIVLQGAALEDARQLALRSNVPSSSDIMPIRQEDLVHQFQPDARQYVEENNLSTPLKPREVAGLKNYLKDKIRLIHQHYDPTDSQLGVVVNKIVDKLIHDQYKKFYPKSRWDTSKNLSTVKQLVFETETFENAKQWLDSFLERPENTDVYKGQKEIHVAYWIKYTKGSVKRDTVEQKLKSLKQGFKKMNSNLRRRLDYNIPPVRRLFFPATFAGMTARCFEWDAATQDFIET